MEVDVHVPIDQELLRLILTGDYIAVALVDGGYDCLTWENTVHVPFEYWLTNRLKEGGIVYAKDNGRVVQYG